MKLKRCLCLLLATVMLLVAFPVSAFAASYPTILCTYDSDETIIQGTTGYLRFAIYPEYKNERYYVKVYDSDGVQVASATDTFYNYDIFSRDLTIRVNTKTLDLQPGTYTVEYWMEFYTLFSWYEIPNHHRDSFEVIENVCKGSHTFKQTFVLNEPTTSKDGEARYTCQKCGHKVWETLSALKITKQPKNVTGKNNQTVKVSVTAKGEGLKYKWYVKDRNAKKFTASSSVKGDTYSLTMNTSNSGRQVYCVVSDKFGNKVTSNTVTLKGPTPLKITEQPTSSSVLNGKTAKVKFAVEGDGLKYKWYVKESGSSKFKASKSNASSYAFTMSKKTSGRQVYCVVTDKYGKTVKTKTVKLTMEVPLKITKQPVGVTTTIGKTAKISVSATGNGLKYKWYFKDKGSSKFSLSASAKTATYSLDVTAARNGRQVYCVITDKHGKSMKTKTVTINVTTPLKITKQPSSVKVAKGKTAKISVTAQGDGLKYKWYIKDTGSSKFAVSSAFTGKTYTADMTASRDGRQVYCVITDKYGNSVKTKTVTLSID